MRKLKRWLGLLFLATISRRAQQQEVVAATLALLADLEYN